jgi:hypothetical protein
MLSRKMRVILVITLAVIFTAVFSFVALSQRLPIKVKVFVGRASNPAAQEAYRVERLSFLKKLASERPNDHMEAVLVLNHFVDAEELTKLTQDHRLEVKEIFVAVPGRRGAGGHVLSPGESIGEALESFAQSMIKAAEDIRKAPYAATIDIEIADENARLAREGKFSIYAARISGKLTDLWRASENEIVKFVDVFYHKRAEVIAKAIRKRVMYIAVPERPDGIP